MDKKSITHDMAKPVFDSFIDRDTLFHINYLKSRISRKHIILYLFLSTFLFWGIYIASVSIRGNEKKEKFAYNDIISISIYLMYLFIR